MKFSVSSSSLLKHLTALDGAISSNPAMPILENFLFELKGDTLSVTASDLQITIIAAVDVSAESDGAMALPAKMLLDTLRNLPDIPVTFNADEDEFTAEISSQTGRYRLTGESASDFPKVPEMSETETVELSCEMLSTAIAYTAFAASSDEMKPNMNGVFMDMNSEGCIFVATDGHRLIRYIRKDIKPEIEGNYILPRKALALLKRNLPHDSSRLDVSFNDSHASFSFGNIRMLCRLIDEKFPDYQNVIPLNNEKVLIVDRAVLTSSVKRIAIYANRSTNQVRLKAGESDLEVSAEDLDFANDATERLAADYEGEAIEIGFNSRFLIESLSNLHSSKVKLQMSEPNRAGLITPVEQEDFEDILMLVMPVMLNNYY